MFEPGRRWFCSCALPMKATWIRWLPAGLPLSKGCSMFPTCCNRLPVETVPLKSSEILRLKNCPSFNQVWWLCRITLFLFTFGCVFFRTRSFLVHCVHLSTECSGPAVRKFRHGAGHSHSIDHEHEDDYENLWETMFTCEILWGLFWWYLVIPQISPDLTQAKRLGHQMMSALAFLEENAWRTVLTASRFDS